MITNPILRRIDILDLLLLLLFLLLLAVLLLFLLAIKKKITLCALHYTLHYITLQKMGISSSSSNT